MTRASQTQVRPQPSSAGRRYSRDAARSDRTHLPMLDIATAFDATASIGIRMRGERVWDQPGQPTVRLRAAAALVDGAVADASDAGYTAFFRAEFPAVVRTVYLILRDTSRAEDVCQEAFIQLLGQWPKISAYERPEAWVRRVAIRLAMRGVRRDRLWVLVRDRIAPPSTQTSSDLDVSEAIRRLPGNQRAAIALFYYEDRSVEEVAAILGCSTATVRVHLHRGRRRLAAFLGEDADSGI